MSENTIRWALETYTKPVFFALITMNIIFTICTAKLWLFFLILASVLALLVFNYKHIPEKQLPKEHLYKVFQFYLVGWTASICLAAIISLNRIQPAGPGNLFIMIVICILLGGEYWALSTTTAKAIYTNLMNKLCNIQTTEDKLHEDTKDVLIATVEGKSVYLLEKDRYVHMLLIGATGAGKTSQAILPMILSDIKKDNRSIIMLEPKGDAAEKVFALAKMNQKKAMYFNPTHPDCPSFNPFYGEEDVVIENTCKIFKTLNKSSNMYFEVMAENLLRYGLQVLKRIEKANTNPKTGTSSKPATTIRFNQLIHNSSGEGRKMIQEFKNIHGISPLEKKQNDDVASWFLDDYFVPNSKTYENTSIVRAQFVKLTNNKYLRRVLNPMDGQSDIRFDQIIEDNVVLAISTAQGILQDLGSYLGYFIMLSFQAAVLRRPGKEETRKPCFFYCDEFQKYADIGFQDVLTQGRSYRISAILATQAIAQLGVNMDAKDGKTFEQIVLTNARNTILFPGASVEDVEYFSKKFGTVKRMQQTRSVSHQNFSLFATKTNPGSNSTSTREVEEAEFSTNDLEFKDFGTITFQLIRNNTLQRAQVGQVAWIPKDVNDRMNELVLQYEDEQEMKAKKLAEEEQASVSHPKVAHSDEPISNAMD